MSCAFLIPQPSRTWPCVRCVVCSARLLSGALSPRHLALSSLRRMVDQHSSTKKVSGSFLAAASQPLHDVLLLVLDGGMRPSEAFQMRWEDLKWDSGFIFVPKGKTRRSRRHVPMSARVMKALEGRRGAPFEGWVFPSPKSRSGHLTTVAKAFAEAKKVAGLPKEIVLYSARHSFATSVLGATGDLSLVMRVCGHSSANTAMIYQHPDLEAVRSVVNERNASLEATSQIASQRKDAIQTI